jgi:hypothetical protein
MIEHFIDMPDGTQLRVHTDGQLAYASRMLTQMEAIWVNNQLVEMGIPERLKGTWVNGS